MDYIYTHKELFAITPKDTNGYHYIYHLPTNKAVWRFTTKKKAKAFCVALTEQSLDWAQVTDLGNQAELLFEVIETIENWK